MRALQEHEFDRAANMLRVVLDKFPEEKELTDRVRLYLSVCERHLQPAPEPRTPAERLLAATLALNAGDASRAVRLLDQVCHDDPGNDQALYLMAVAVALSGEPQRAAPFLARAIEVNAGNRARARVDPDLESFRHDAGIAALLNPGVDPAGVSGSRQ
jgi:cytochrome c-type biogenesis protein CcmH/NrfG